LLLAALLTGAMIVKAKLRGWELPLAFFIGSAAASSYVALGLDLWAANRGLVEWVVTGSFGGLLLLATLSLGGPLAQWCAGGAALPEVAPLGHLVRWIRRNEQGFDGRARLLGGLRFAFLFGAAFMCLVLFLDPRYRDFPLALYAVPSIGFALFSFIHGKGVAELEEILLAGLIATLSIFIAISEHLATSRDAPWTMAEALNPYALLWFALSLLLAGSVLVPIVLELRTGKHQYAQQESGG
jgi:glucan 1,3-beta-glucosidase